MKCTQDNCNNNMLAKLLCNKHYLQMRKYGNPGTSTREKRPAIIKEDYALIPLGVDACKGYAKVDIENASLDSYLWSMHHSGGAHGVVNGKLTTMESLIVDRPDGMMIDHINHDRADNRKSNLRVCTRTENRRNSVKSKRNVSGYKGVAKYGSMTYVAQIGYEGKKIRIGEFDNPEEAARAYDMRAKELFGEFAYLNFNEMTRSQE